jgi:hypothetical protein
MVGFSMFVLSQKAIGQLHEAVIIAGYRSLAQAPYVLAQFPLTPIISRGFLGAGSLAGTRCFEQRRGGCGVKAGIVAGRESVIAART